LLIENDYDYDLLLSYCGPTRTKTIQNTFVDREHICSHPSQPRHITNTRVTETHAGTLTKHQCRCRTHAPNTAVHLHLLQHQGAWHGVPHFLQHQGAWHGVHLQCTPSAASPDRRPSCATPRWCLPKSNHPLPEPVPACSANVSRLRRLVVLLDKRIRVRLLVCVCVSVRECRSTVSSTAWLFPTRKHACTHYIIQSLPE
jgi:hypothetical protein